MLKVHSSNPTVAGIVFPGPNLNTLRVRHLDGSSLSENPKKIIQCKKLKKLNWEGVPRFFFFFLKV